MGIDSNSAVPLLASLSVEEIRQYLCEAEELAEEEIALLRDDPRAGVRNLCSGFLRRREGLAKEEERLRKMLQRENRLWDEGYVSIAGVDEAGRGPLAGPVVAAAVILAGFGGKIEFEGRADREAGGDVSPAGRGDDKAETDKKGDVLVWRDLNDSKQLSLKKREELFRVIMEHAAGVGIGIVEAAVIDEINIHQASLEAMKQALSQLNPAPDFVLTDGGFRIPGIELPQEAIIGGDGVSLSIAAASVIAKVTRDRLMEEYDKQYPGYGFARNKGYPTAEHRKAVKSIGFSALHRRTFRVR